MQNQITGTTVYERAVGLFLDPPPGSLLRMLQSYSIAISADLDERDRQSLGVLLNRGSVVSDAIQGAAHLQARSLRLTNVKVALSPLADNGKNRRVFKLDISQGDDLRITCALKLARYVGETTADHAVMSYYVNQRLGKPSGAIYQIDDGRLVSVGTFVEGANGDRIFPYQRHATMRAIIAESLSIWKTLGGYFIPEPKGDQFLISKSEGRLKATLIDKGDFKKLPHKESLYSLERCPTTQRVTIRPSNRDLMELSSWLDTMSCYEVVSRVLVQLNCDIVNFTTSDPDQEAFASMDRLEIPLYVEPEAVLLGVSDAFGPECVGPFARDYSGILRSGSEKIVMGSQDSIADSFLSALSAGAFDGLK